MQRILEQAFGVTYSLNGLYDFLHIDGSQPPAGVSPGDELFDRGPLLIRQVRRVGLPCHTLFIGEIPASHTGSKTLIQT